ncbi:hypothetical protein RJT34_27867 [Clitoria ternatea]|uniref:Uncharacterized protein n=1 Tax=Clitoria ternatea TaxID=43366 RepID=A0AAN9FA94_CLITE
MLTALTVLPSWVASPPELSHIPSPCGAASSPLPFGTGHETNILFFILVFYWAKGGGIFLNFYKKVDLEYVSGCGVI